MSRGKAPARHQSPGTAHLGHQVTRPSNGGDTFLTWHLLALWNLGHALVKSGGGTSCDIFVTMSPILLWWQGRPLDYGLPSSLPLKRSPVTQQGPQHPFITVVIGELLWPWSWSMIMLVSGDFKNPSDRNFSLGGRGVPRGYYSPLSVKLLLTNRPLTR